MTKKHNTHATVAHDCTVKPPTPMKDVASGKNDRTGKSVSHEDIRLCAFHKWEVAGKPSGDGVQFWLAAEQELMEDRGEKFLPEDGRQGPRDHESLEDMKNRKESHISADSHYRDNNRMFQRHGDRGHRHGASE